MVTCAANRYSSRLQINRYKITTDYPMNSLKNEVTIPGRSVRSLFMDSERVTLKKKKKEIF